jgi:hypothetical protein
VPANLCVLSTIQRHGLPLYPISPIEAALLPLGVLSNSSCALLPFIQWIVKSERIMEYRIGNVRTLHLYRRRNLGRDSWKQRFMVIGLENRRHIENWLKIELSGPDSSVFIFSGAFVWHVAHYLGRWVSKVEGTVTFGSTPEALNESLRAFRSVRFPDDTLPVTRFAQKIQDAFEHSSSPVCSRVFLSALHVTDNGENTDHSICPEFGA